MKQAPDPEVFVEIEGRVRELYEGMLDPIAARFDFEPSPSGQTSGTPLVLFLGNHSSGKSSFINHLTGEQLQRTGIAPIDDGFTILAHGDKVEDRDGAAIVTDPDLPWGDLQKFGPQLTSHLRMRRLQNPKLQGIALVDSPGMIDSADAKIDRGYDFSAVVRWFAERADVILLLFDPDKPGTTGETLQVLTHALTGLDHKLLLIFNKVDRFTTMRDFARAYGALCWNLAKAIPRKDLPHVYNTYLPSVERPVPAKSIPLADFDRSLDEVAAEVQRAPYRRLDNVISHLYEYTRRLRLHTQVLTQLSRERLKHKLHTWLAGGAIALTAVLAISAAYAWAGETRWQWITGLLLVAAAACAGTYGVHVWQRRARQKTLSLEALFERAFSRELALDDEADDLRALWQAGRERVNRALLAQGAHPPRLRSYELRCISQILDEQVPELRAYASDFLSGGAERPAS